jgi:proteic killer suppression protein
MSTRVGVHTASRPALGVPCLPKPLAKTGPLDRIPGRGIFRMIRSFSDRRTESLFDDRVVPAFGDIARRAKRKLEAIHAAARLDDLRVPPSNRLEKLKGSSEPLYSIRINDQWRVVFRWLDGDAYDVAIVDYH